jgi:hypothetical protein
MRLYKFTTQENKTRDVTWHEGMTFVIPANQRQPALCTSGVVHAYRNRDLAFLLNRIHADFTNPKLWECFGQIVVEDYGKCACYELTMGQPLLWPEWYRNETIRLAVSVNFAIFCAESVLKYFEVKFPTDNCPRKDIEAAQEYLRTGRVADAYAARAAYAATYAEAYAARSAVYAAACAAHAARATHAAAYAAVYATARVTARSAAAACAADAACAARAASAAGGADFGFLADCAVELVMNTLK